MLYMGVHKLPNRRIYWGTFTNVPVISETMIRNRFDEILSILHFNDNNLASPSTLPDHNKLHKIQPVIEFFNARFSEVVFPETNEAVDEMMIPFKGKHSVKMYMPKKPVNGGINFGAELAYLFTYMNLTFLVVKELKARQKTFNLNMYLEKVKTLFCVLSTISNQGNTKSFLTIYLIAQN